ncbi:MAG: phosphoribosylamine--glycine ligase [Acidobacteriota bacterium]
MDVLVVGGGGREHALVWALHRSSAVDKLYCAPGNAGISEIATCLGTPAGNPQALTSFAVDNLVDLVVVGPEAPLTGGLTDLLSEQGIPCFGPSRRAAVLEGSKAFSKAFMARHQIPTAPFEVFDNATAAAKFVTDPPWGFPLVVKADGLAAGKGVVICPDVETAVAAITAAMVDGAFGSAGERVVAEAYVEGAEATCMALCDGEQAVALLPSQDHKAANDGDKGPNTGGMGAYAPAESVVDEALAERITREILQPTIEGMAAEARTFRGVIYAGLMITDAGPLVLEFNCRFGDPETQVVLPLLDEDITERLAAIARGEQVGGSLRWSGRSCACVVLAAPGYPGRSPYGLPIVGLDKLTDMPDLLVFHAATARENHDFVTSGGRVLGVTGLGDTLDEALERAYKAIEEIRFEGMHYRSDIGQRVKDESK